MIQLGHATFVLPKQNLSPTLAEKSATWATLDYAQVKPILLEQCLSVFFGWVGEWGSLSQKLWGRLPHNLIQIYKEIILIGIAEEVLSV